MAFNERAQEKKRLHAVASETREGGMDNKRRQNRRYSTNLQRQDRFNPIARHFRRERITKAARWQTYQNSANWTRWPRSVLPLIPWRQELCHPIN